MSAICSVLAKFKYSNKLYSCLTSKPFPLHQFARRKHFNLPQNALVYTFKDFPLFTARIAGFFGVGTFLGASVYAWITLKNDERPPASDIFGSFYRVITHRYFLAAVSLASAGLCYYFTATLSSRIVKKIFISADRTKTTVVLYNVWQGTRKVTHPVANLSRDGGMVYVKGKPKYYLSDLAEINHRQFNLAFS